MKDIFPIKNAFSPRQFAERNGIGVTKTYGEIKAGRLVARKCGSRTIITVEDERSWMQQLPLLPTDDLIVKGGRNDL